MLLFCFYPFKKRHPRQERIKVTEFKGILKIAQTTVVIHKILTNFLENNSNKYV